MRLLINVASYCVFVGLASTGLILAYRLPAGSCSDCLLGISRNEWGAIHFYLALAFLGLLFFHLFLNWKWVACTFGVSAGVMRREGGGRVRWGLPFLFVIGAITVAAMAGPWLARVEGGGGRRRGRVEAIDRGDLEAPPGRGKGGSMPVEDAPRGPRGRTDRFRSGWSRDGNGLEFPVVSSLFQYLASTSRAA